jgi:leader peptidase (prepilin peptidase)/N-methyltransferase|tara:strand:- start:619 stop:1128 length:510 start_codon:yes stop_codon:yes gene_type:complete
VLVVYSFGLSWLTLPFLILAWSLFTLALIDSRYQFLPDEITLPVLWLGIFISSLNLNSEVSLHESVIGAIAGYTSLWFFNFFYKLVRKKEGIGHGDFKLFSTLGAWLGWQSLLPIIVFSSTVGSIYGVLAIILLRKDKFTSIPFGPFLTGAGFIFLLWGEQLNKFLWAS